MPAFDPIGFFLPLCVAILYLPRALPYLRTRTTVYLAVLGYFTYLMPFWNPGGQVGLGMVPFYVFFMWFQVLPARTKPPRWWPERLPMAALVPYTFASLAVPDTFLTWQGGGALWTVGGQGWQDGLVRLWLFVLPGFAAFRALADFGCAKDQGEPFRLRRWMIEQLAPWRPGAAPPAPG